MLRTAIHTTEKVYKQVASPLALLCILASHGFNKFWNLSFSLHMSLGLIYVNSYTISVAMNME